MAPLKELADNEKLMMWATIGNVNKCLAKTQTTRVVNAKSSHKCYEN